MGAFDDIELDDEFGDEEPISKEEFAKLILGRLPRDVQMPQLPQPAATMTEPRTPLAQRTVRINLINKLVAILPENLRTRSVATQGDIRALLFKVIGDSEELEDTEIDGQTFTAKERQLALYTNVELGMRWDKDYENGLTAIAGAPTDAEDIDTVRSLAQDQSREYRQGRLNRMFWQGETVTNPVTGEVTQTENTQGGNELLEALGLSSDFLTSGGSEMPRKFMTTEEYQRLLQTGELTQDVLAQAGDIGTVETTKLNPDGTADQQLVTARPRVLYSEDEVQRTKLPDEMPGGQRGYQIDPYSGRDWYSYTEMTGKPATMTREEAIEVTRKMKAAGIFDITGGEPVIPGDVTDPSFKAAWKHLIGMSLETGKPMLSILEERRDAYADELAARAGLSLTDPARLRIQADGIARNLLGRKFSPDEQKALVDFVHDLERRNAQVEAGLDPETPDGVTLDEGIIADIDAQMEEYIRAQNPEEAEGHDVADSYDMFTSFIRGPGRGI